MMHAKTAVLETRPPRPKGRRTRSAWLARVKPEETLSAALILLLRMAPGFFLAYAELLDMPSGLHVAYLAALSAVGQPLGWTMAGCGLAFAMRFVWGIPPHVEVMASCMVCAAAGKLVRGRGNLAVCLLTGCSLLPLPVVAWLTGTARDAVLAFGSVAVSVLSAPVMVRALASVRQKRGLDSLDARLSAVFFGCLMLAGGGRLLLFGIHVGMFAAAVACCLASLCLGASAGMLCGLVGGLALALQGVPLEGCVALAMGGFLAGMAREMDRRYLTCAAFALGATLLLILSGQTGGGYLAATLSAALVTAVMPGMLLEKASLWAQRLAGLTDSPRNSYAAEALSKWEKTVQEMAEAIPDPGATTEERDGAWWQQHLCCECPDRAKCDVMTTPLALERAEALWAKRDEPTEDWQEALEMLRGLGCGRLYCLRAGMDQLREDERTRSRHIRRACEQRDMLVTHLLALSGAAKRFAVMTQGNTWWEEVSTRRVRQALNDNAVPASLLYVRKVHGHAVAAMEVHSPQEGKKLQKELTDLVSSVLQMRMFPRQVEGDRLCLAEMPAFGVRVGVAGRGAESARVNGDATCTDMLEDGRFLAILSDGMGQGQRASYESATAVKLLRLCLEAGYTRDQALCAANGMMLLETGGERFATADLLTIDLWSGQAEMDKLGAAGSWLLRGTTLVQLTGDALPVGVMERVESRCSVLRMKDGDSLVMLTDGVEDAFASKEDLESAIRRALGQPDPSTGAEYLLEQAQKAERSGRRDDMTAMVMQVVRQSR